MKIHTVLSYMVASLIGVKAAVFPPSRFPFQDKMATKEIPQFITITFDDGITLEKYLSFKKYILDIQDSRGCPPRITHFTSFDWTQCEPVKFLYDSGAVEQGHHTGMHTARPTAAQIKSAMDQLVGCGIPASDVTGFRTPYLDYDSTTFTNLAQLKVIYDTTLIQDDDVASGYGANNTWPFTLENGFTGSIKCGVTGSCINQSYPDMWEIPMYRWYSKSNGVLNDIMDYTTFTTDVQQMFERHYNGNRAPFGIYLHYPWLANNGAALKSWIESIMAKYSDVYFVTNMDLLEWMQNPVPKSHYVPKACKTREQMFGCMPPAPSYTCSGYGQYFDFETCKCDCKQGFCPINGGPVNGGTCTDWNCPTTPVAPLPTPPVAPVQPAPAPAPSPPTTQGPGCCSHDFKTCVTWCGTTESQCLTCGTASDPTIWLANGPLTNSTCFARWSGYGCTSNSVCCPGLACIVDSGGTAKACLPDPNATVTAPTAPAPTAPTPTAPIPTAPTPTAQAPTTPTAPTPTVTSTTSIPLGGQCGTTTSGDQFGLYCVSSTYCAWTDANKQTCQSCKRAPLNAFDCQNYKVACGSTKKFSVCPKVRKLRGVNASI